MLWKEIKSWAKTNGYQTDRTKVDNEENPYHYTWSRIDNPDISGTSMSVSKLACTIYNHMSNNEHIEYQARYKEKLSQEDIDHNEYGIR